MDVLSFERLLSRCFPGPGLAPAGEVLFFASPKKSTQKKGDPAVCVPARLRRTGQPAVLGRGAAPWNSLRAGALRSDSHGGSDHEAGVSCGTPARPAPCAPRRNQKGEETTRVIAALDLAFAALRPCAKQAAEVHTQHPNAGPSAATARVVPCPCGRAEKHSAAGAPACRRTRRLRALTRRGCLNGAATQRSEFHGGPRRASIAGCPGRQRRSGSRTSGRLFFAYFLLAKQKKVSAPPGAHPGPGKQNPGNIKTANRPPPNPKALQPWTPHISRLPRNPACWPPTSL